MIGFGPHIDVPFQQSWYWDSCINSYECKLIIIIIVTGNYNIDVIAVIQRGSVASGM
jgi:hypothetical protein